MQLILTASKGPPTEFRRELSRAGLFEAVEDLHSAFALMSQCSEAMQAFKKIFGYQSGVDSFGDDGMMRQLADMRHVAAMEGLRAPFTDPLCQVRSSFTWLCGTQASLTVSRIHTSGLSHSTRCTGAFLCCICRHVSGCHLSFPWTTNQHPNILSRIQVQCTIPGTTYDLL